MEISWIVEFNHGVIFDSLVPKNVLRRKRKPVACRDGKGKMVETLEYHNFLLETQNWENK
jgi:hypothetical protein